MNSQKNPLSTYTVAAGVVGQVGCLLAVSVFGLLLLGLLLDRLLGTKPTFLFIFLLGSIPLNLWMIYRYTLHKTRSLQVPSTEEEDSATND